MTLHPLKSRLALASILLLSQASTPALAHSTPVASLRGYATTHRILTERIVKPSISYNFAAYLDEHYYPGSFFLNGLLELLGVYAGSSSFDSSFRNGNPNVINTVLWHILFSGLSEDIGKLCVESASPNPLLHITQDSFRSALQPLCSWPSPASRSNDALLAFWLALMSFDAPIEEFDSWREFFQGPTYEQASASEAVAAMSLAILDNPHFLLRK
jgi:hypothetical protein